MLPVPEKRSSTEIPVMSYLLIMMLNKLSLARSVVGLALKFFGGYMIFPLYFPLIIRKGKGLTDSGMYATESR